MIARHLHRGYNEANQLIHKKEEREKEIMKRLVVFLLAVSMTFTFSVSSAFAADLTEENQIAVTVTQAKVAYAQLIRGDASVMDKGGYFETEKPEDDLGNPVTTVWNRSDAVRTNGGKAVIVMNDLVVETAGAVVPVYDKENMLKMRASIQHNIGVIANQTSMKGLKEWFAILHRDYMNIPTTQQHLDAWNQAGELGKAYTEGNYEQIISDYAKDIAAKVNSNEDYDKKITIKEAAKAMKKVLFQAYTVKDLPYKLEQVKKMTTDIVSPEELKKQLAEVDNNVELGYNGVRYMAELREKYNSHWGADYSIASPENDQLLNQKLIAEEAKIAAAVDDTYQKLEKASIEDKNDVEQLRYIFNDVNDYCRDYLGTPTTAKTTEAQVAALERRYEEAMGAAVKEQLEKMPANPKTPNQVILVKRARWAFDDLIPEEQLKIVGTTLYQKLLDAEKIKKATMIAGVAATTVKLGAKATDRGIELKISRSKGYKIDYYRVYRATSRNGKYKYLYTNTVPTTPINFSVRSGKTYYYKVVGVKQMFGKQYRTKVSNIASARAK